MWVCVITWMKRWGLRRSVGCLGTAGLLVGDRISSSESGSGSLLFADSHSLHCVKIKMSQYLEGNHASHELMNLIVIFTQGIHPGKLAFTHTDEMAKKKTTVMNNHPIFRTSLQGKKIQSNQKLAESTSQESWKTNSKGHKRCG